MDILNIRVSWNLSDFSNDNCDLQRRWQLHSVPEVLTGTKMFAQSIDVDFSGIDLRKQLSVLEMVADIDDHTVFRKNIYRSCEALFSKKKFHCSRIKQPNLIKFVQNILVYAGAYEYNNLLELTEERWPCDRCDPLGRRWPNFKLYIVSSSSCFFASTLLHITRSTLLFIELDPMNVVAKIPVLTCYRQQPRTRYLEKRRVQGRYSPLS